MSTETKRPPSAPIGARFKYPNHPWALKWRTAEYVASSPAEFQGLLKRTGLTPDRYCAQLKVSAALSRHGKIIGHYIDAHVKDGKLMAKVVIYPTSTSPDSEEAIVELHEKLDRGEMRGFSLGIVGGHDENRQPIYINPEGSLCDEGHDPDARMVGVPMELRLSKNFFNPTTTQTITTSWSRQTMAEQQQPEAPVFKPVTFTRNKPTADGIKLNKLKSEEELAKMDPDERTIYEAGVTATKQALLDRQMELFKTQDATLTSIEAFLNENPPLASDDAVVDTVPALFASASSSKDTANVLRMLSTAGEMVDRHKKASEESTKQIAALQGQLTALRDAGKELVSTGKFNKGAVVAALSTVFPEDFKAAAAETPAAAAPQPSFTRQDPASAASSSRGWERSSSTMKTGGNNTPAAVTSSAPAIAVNEERRMAPETGDKRLCPGYAPSELNAFLEQAFFSADPRHTDKRFRA